MDDGRMDGLRVERTGRGVETKSKSVYSPIYQLDNRKKIGLELREEALESKMDFSTPRLPLVHFHPKTEEEGIEYKTLTELLMPLSSLPIRILEKQNVDCIFSSFPAKRKEPVSIATSFVPLKLPQSTYLTTFRSGSLSLLASPGSHLFCITTNAVHSALGENHSSNNSCTGEERENKEKYRMGI